MKIRLGTRGSRLALAQTQWVASQLEAVHPDLSISIVTIQTKGDAIQNVALDKIGDKGLFVKEIEMALLSGEIDAAVHSLKDMPSQETQGLMFVPSLKRADPRDVLIANQAFETLKGLERQVVVGTGSKRRAFQIHKTLGPVDVQGIRGNVDTRLRKLNEGLYDVIVLAKAGLDRLDIKPAHVRVLSFDEMLPAPAQGLLGVQIRQDDPDLLARFEALKDPVAHLQMLAERAFMKGVQGGCHIPMGAYLTVHDHGVSLEGLLGSESGDIILRETVTGQASEAQALGERLAKHLTEEMRKYDR